MSTISLRDLRTDKREPVFGLMVAPRVYRCMLCGYTRPVNTNHTDVCFSYCECSWRSGYVGEYLGKHVPELYYIATQKERPCEYVGPDVKPEEINPHARNPSHALILVFANLDKTNDGDAAEPDDDITIH
jgi:hypothetical protein